ARAQLWGELPPELAILAVGGLLGGIGTPGELAGLPSRQRTEARADLGQTQDRRLDAAAEPIEQLELHRREPRPGGALSGVAEHAAKVPRRLGEALLEVRRLEPEPRVRREAELDRQWRDVRRESRFLGRRVLLHGLADTLRREHQIEPPSAGVDLPARS